MQERTCRSRTRVGLQGSEESCGKIVVELSVVCQDQQSLRLRPEEIFREVYCSRIARIVNARDKTRDAAEWHLSQIALAKRAAIVHDNDRLRESGLRSEVVKHLGQQIMSFVRDDDC